MTQDVERVLEKAGISGFTVTRAKGVGEWEKKVSLFNGPSTHFKIEIFAEVNRAEQIAIIIMDAAYTGSAGDDLLWFRQCKRSSGFGPRLWQNPGKFSPRHESQSKCRQPPEASMLVNVSTGHSIWLCVDQSANI
jgi:nitrogen regulatory protein PII